MEELRQQYLDARHAAGSFASTRRLTPEEKEQEDLRRANDGTRANSLFSQMIDLATDEFIAIPSTRRRGYLIDLRRVFSSGPTLSAAMSDSEVNEFMDRLIVQIVDRLSGPKSSR